MDNDVLQSLDWMSNSRLNDVIGYLEAVHHNVYVQLR